MPEKTRIYFQKTRDLLKEMKKQYPDYPLHELSMGMSHDYHIALKKEGDNTCQNWKSIISEIVLFS